MKKRRIFITALLTVFVSVFLLACGKTEETVTAEAPLTDEEKEKLKNKLEAMTKSTVSMEYFIDESLLGGLIAEIDGKVLDGSLRKRLHDIKEVINE